ncbi:hypothetical protein CALCODRAFT_474307 [Calocera cornea HHB12733]|uniref:Eukaryotic mitochondrial regulator protein-domain-containing protein n=1 Tax=Calocera cornea HHB12733 TaxID=1353952 RepID=A0A165DY58_9BASI|nr:hypothetical protein CALCODRAFT_474307 [Calocera cornea HHB12733]
MRAALHTLPTLCNPAARTRPAASFCLVRAVLSEASVRQFASSSRARFPAGDEPTNLASERNESRDEDGERGRDSQDQDRQAPDRPNYAQWLATIGEKYKLPVEGEPNNWLEPLRESFQPQPKRPFPTNPSFQPPAPMSNNNRNELFRAWKKEPNEKTIRALSNKYGISIDRVNAIIKLKEHEIQLLKTSSVPLQMAFCEGMEKFLGVKNKRAEGKVEDQEVAWDDDQAASQDEHAWHAKDTHRDIDEDEAYARGHRPIGKQPQSIIWDLVGEGDGSIIAERTEIVQKARAQRLARARRKLEDPPTVHVPPSKRGRPSWAFVDVGDKFSNTREKEVQRHAQQWSATVHKVSWSSISFCNVVLIIRCSNGQLGCELDHSVVCSFGWQVAMGL